MSRFLDKEPNILPKVAKPTLAFLSIVSNLEKMAIIEEGEGKISRNFKDLDLSNSIYTKE
jgi:hypothetical protein